MELEPRPVIGVTWLVEAEDDDSLRVTARVILREVATAVVAIRVRAPGEYQATVRGSVKAGWGRRGIGSAIIAWAEEVALARVAVMDPRGTVTLAIDTSGASEGERALFAATGLELTVAEVEMRRPLQALPPVAPPPGVELRPWTEDTAPSFYTAYVDAFRERPGFPNWSEERWRTSFASGDSFRPDLSAVALQNGDPAGFAVLWVEGDTGWVIQMGVRPPWRGKGVGEALLAHAMSVFAAEGLTFVALDVATNNPVARALYERLSFRVTSRYESWRKALVPKA